jgi:hypothetical protein
MSKWISPAASMDMVYDDPAGRGPDTDFGFALLWASGRKGDEQSSVDLARAKLQPRKPASSKEPNDAVITASDYRLVLAAGVPDLHHPLDLFRAYEDQRLPGQKLLAVVQTLRFDPDQPRHAMMQTAHVYASFWLRRRRLSSLLVQHVPGDAGSARGRPHVHILTPVRAHRLSGFGEIDAQCRIDPTAMHVAFERDWQAARDLLARLDG